MDEIRAGSIVKLFYWQDKKIHDFTVTDIYFEHYVSDYKTIVKAKYYSEKAGYWFSETFFSNDFIKWMTEAKKMEANKNE